MGKTCVREFPPKAGSVSICSCGGSSLRISGVALFPWLEAVGCVAEIFNEITIEIISEMVYMYSCV